LVKAIGSRSLHEPIVERNSDSTAARTIRAQEVSFRSPLYCSALYYLHPVGWTPLLRHSRELRKDRSGDRCCHCYGVGPGSNLLRQMAPFGERLYNWHQRWNSPPLSRILALRTLQRNFDNVEICTST